MTGALPGLDGTLRCPWALATPDLLAYHDSEWGRPVHGDSALLERLCLEAFQSGLSWLTVLRKRPAFREAFAGFEPHRLATFGAADVDRLLLDARLIRNRAKIEAAIGNARATLELGPGGLDAAMWSFAPPSRARPTDVGDVPASTAESAAMAKALRRTGFRFLGPTTAYAAMQACGLVDDHLADCGVLI